jgi:hypothetical protein
LAAPPPPVQAAAAWFQRHAAVLFFGSKTEDAVLMGIFKQKHLKTFINTASCVL